MAENCWPAVVNVYTYWELCMSNLHVLEVEIKGNVLTKAGTCTHSDPCPGFRAVRTDDFWVFGGAVSWYRFELP
jgi:hypothetical protein